MSSFNHFFSAQSLISYIPDIIGCLGGFFILITYLLIQLSKMDPKDLSYSLLNLVGAIFILFSLLDSWNIAAFIIELAWMMMSLFGVYKWFISAKLKPSSHL